MRINWGCWKCPTAMEATNLCNTRLLAPEVWHKALEPGRWSSWTIHRKPELQSGLSRLSQSTKQPRPKLHHFWYGQKHKINICDSSKIKTLQNDGCNNILNKSLINNLSDFNLQIFCCAWMTLLWLSMAIAASEKASAGPTVLKNDCAKSLPT